MTNDTNTLNGALQELGETMASNLQAKGVTASASDGLTTLAGKILTIPSGGSCYHIEFSEDSYTAVGGSCTVEIMLQENYQPKANATVTVTGSDSSLYTGLTNNDGVAEVIVSNISGTVTFTCTYSNVSDTCSVTGSTYLFYDACDSSSGLSNYDLTNIVKVNGTQSNPTMVYDSNMNSYKLYGSGNYRSGIMIPSLDGLDNYTASMEVRCTKNDWLNSLGFGLLIDSTSSSSYCFAGQVRGSSEWRAIRYTINSTSNTALGSSDKSLSTSANGKWLRTEMIVNDTQITWKLYDGDTLLCTDGSYTITDNNKHRLGLIFTTEKGNNYICYCRNIKVEAL